jgi:hypothetical protein
MVERSSSQRRQRRGKSSGKLVVVGFALIGVQLLLLWFGFNLQHPAPESTSILGPSQLLASRKQIPDGTFNGYPIYYRQQIDDTRTYSMVNCAGENYQKESWMHRSCHFSFLCFDVKEQEFVVFRQPDEKLIIPHLQQRPLMDVSSSYIMPVHNTSVSLGGINRKWGKDVSRLEWFPRVLEESPTSFYTLPADVVLIPFHSLSGGNPGHLLWDEFLAIYTLLTMFELEDSNPLLLRYILPGIGLWASCDWTEKTRSACDHMHRKFWPLMTRNNNTKLTTQTDVDLQWTIGSENSRKSNLVCARHGVGGIGALSDHGTKKFHGWHDADYKTTHNHGRGGVFWKFREFALQNLGVVDQPLTRPYKIVFSMSSSSTPLRNLDFTKQIEMLKLNIDEKDAVVETYTFKDHSMQEQVEIASQTAIYITGCGGGAATATFLPRGSTLLLYFNEPPPEIPAGLYAHSSRLDWDFFNNIGYFRVHWLPSHIMNSAEDMSALLQLVQHELNVMKLEV